MAQNAEMPNLDGAPFARAFTALADEWSFGIIITEVWPLDQ
jgi:hypothetical protein